MRQWLIKVMRDKPILLQPIESGGTGIGIPDIFFRTRVNEGWIELKIAKIIKGSFRIKIDWRMGQLNWISRYVSLRGKVLLMIGIEITNEFILMDMSGIRAVYADLDEMYDTAVYRGLFSYLQAPAILRCISSV